MPIRAVVRERAERRLARRPDRRSTPSRTGRAPLWPTRPGRPGLFPAGSGEPRGGVPLGTRDDDRRRRGRRPRTHGWSCENEEGKPFTGVLTGNAEADKIIQGMVTSGGEPWDTAVAKMYEANDQTFALPANPADAEFKTALQDAVNSVLNGQADARRGPERSADRPRSPRSTRRGQTSRPGTDGVRHHGRGRIERTGMLGDRRRGRAATVAAAGGSPQRRVSAAVPVAVAHRILHLHGMAADLQRLPVVHGLRRHQRSEHWSDSRTTRSCSPTRRSRWR